MICLILQCEHALLRRVLLEWWAPQEKRGTLVSRDPWEHQGAEGPAGTSGPQSVFTPRH